VFHNIVTGCNWVDSLQVIVWIWDVGLSEGWIV
jgi:hypothetical protein